MCDRLHQPDLYDGMNIYAVTLSAVSWVINQQLPLSIIADALDYFSECFVVQHFHKCYLVINLHIPKCFISQD